MIFFKKALLFKEEYAIYIQNNKVLLDIFDPNHNPILHPSTEFQTRDKKTNPTRSLFAWIAEHLYGQTIRSYCQTMVPLQTVQAANLGSCKKRVKDTRCTRG